MTIVAIVFALLLATPLIAAADTVEIVWDPATGATSYDVERSSNFNPATGAGTWTVVGANVLPSACSGTPVQCSFSDTTAPATGAFYRLTVKNAAGALVITKKGMWYCGACPELPAKPASAGVTL